MKTTELLFFLSSLFCVALLNCCKPPAEDLPSEKGIIFRISGIEEGSSTELMGSTKSRNSQNLEKFPIHRELHNVNGMDIDLIIEENAGMKFASTKAVSSKPIGDNTRFLIMLFEADGNGNAVTFKWLSNSTGNGPTIPFPAYRNRQYRWFAYSYNTNYFFPQPTVESPILNVNTMNEDESDFLYATGVITTSNDPNAPNVVPITFKRMVSAIRFEIDARGAFSSIKDLRVDYPASSNGFKDGKFSLRNGVFTETSDTEQFSKPAWLDHIADTIPTGWVKYQQLYTVPNGEPMNFQALLKSLTITSQTINPDDPTARTFADRNFGVPTAGIPLNFPAFTPVAGKRYTIKLRLKESTLLVGGSNWARGNLTYVANSPRNKYRFWYDNNFIKNVNGGMNNFIETDYFDTRPPRGEPQAEPSNWDPCALVYPERTWRLPTEAEYARLGDLSEAYDRHRVNQQNNAGWYGSWGNRPGVGPPRFKHNNLNFVAAGYRERGTRRLIKFNYSATSPSPDEGFFKTSDTTKFFNIDYGGFFGVDLGIRVATSREGFGANVRCVRR